MRRLAVLVTIVAAAHAGCGTFREGLVRDEPAVPESLAPGLPPITADVDRGPFPPSYHAAAARKPIRTAGFRPGINGEGAIAPPRRRGRRLARAACRSRRRHAPGRSRDGRRDPGPAAAARCDDAARSRPGPGAAGRG